MELIIINKKLLRAIKDGREDVFYKSRTWQKKRAEILDRDNNECQICKGLGGVGKGEVVHHIKHLKKYPTLGLTNSNLITLCFNHHIEVHPEEFKVKKKAALNEERW